MIYRFICPNCGEMVGTLDDLICPNCGSKGDKRTATVLGIGISKIKQDAKNDQLSVKDDIIINALKREYDYATEYEQNLKEQLFLASPIRKIIIKALFFKELTKK